MIVCDPLADKGAVRHEYGVELIDYSQELKVDGIVVAVAHKTFKERLTPAVMAQHFSNDSSEGVVIDVKGMFNAGDFIQHKVTYWRL